MMTIALQEQLKAGQDHVDQVNEKMNELQNISRVLDKARLGKVSMTIDKETIYLNAALSGETLEKYKGLLILEIEEAGNKAMDEYLRLIGKAPEIEPEKFAKVVIEAIKEPEAPKEQEAPKETKKVSLLTVETVKDLYHDQMLSMDAIAKKTGTTKQEVHDFIGENGLKRPGKRERETYRDTTVQSARRS